MLTEEQNQQIADLIMNLINKLGSQGRVSVEQNINGNIFNISSPDSKLLIGQKGNNLYAMQTLVQTIAYRKFQVEDRFSLDVDGYKQNREAHLRDKAKAVLFQVRRTSAPIRMEPMGAYERRIVHAYLSTENDIETESVGQDPDRRIIVKPKAKGDF